VTATKQTFDVLFMPVPLAGYKEKSIHNAVVQYRPPFCIVIMASLVTGI